MDPSQATKVVYSRINKLETEDVAKEIISYILLQDQYDREMIRLAFGPDNLIHGTIGRVKSELGLVSKPTSSPSMNLVTIPNLRPQFSPCLPVLSPPFPSPKTVRVPTTYCEPPLTYSNSIEEDYRYQLEQVNQGQSDFEHDYYYPEEALGNLTLSRPEFPVKVCHYYNKGFCKHGTNCRYFHGQSFQDSYPQIFSPNSNDVANDDQVLLPGSLERLELEITEILKSRRGNPVSIASLPMMYYERFGKTLQAEGYLTESQRHGKTGYSLTKLLERLKNGIRLIDRPHGQHAVILMEDAPKFMENRFERNDPGPIVSGSRQIYLTFPAESSFTEEDVSNYFNSFGPVQDVRIPFQQKRMFGFVTFVCSESVKMTLSKGNPHYVCGARVLVKPYREKSKLVGRKYAEKLEPSVYNHCHEEDMDSELQARWESSRLLRKQLIEEHKHALEIERRRLSQLQLARKSVSPVKQTNFGYSMGELKVLHHSKFSAASPFNCQSDVFHSSSTNDRISKHEGANCTNQENSQGLELPDNPCASPLSSSISAVK